jgi:lipopolysaccharide transport system permease protein
MLTPLIGLILGIAVLLEATLAYRGSYLFLLPPIASRKRSHVLLASGKVSIAIALAIGMLGYFNLINAPLLRQIRIALIVVGLLPIAAGLLRGGIYRRSVKEVTHLVENLKRSLLVKPQLWTKLYLLKTLVQRDLEARYKGSILGNFWPLLNQLSQLLIYTYVFSIVMRVKLSLRGLPENNSLTFGLWLFAGLLPWIAFTNGLLQSSNSVVGNSNLVKKVVFPLSLLPLVPVLSTFVESTFGLMALIFLVAVTTKTIHITLWLLPLLWLTQILFTSGLAYIAAGLTVFLRDIPQTLAVILNIWLYLAPIVYPESLIPPQIRNWVFWLNPMATIAETYRGLVLVGEVKHWGEWAIASIISVVVFAGGFWVYKKLRPAFADVL